MVDTPNKTFLEMCLAKRLLDKHTAAEVYRRARQQQCSAAAVLLDMGVLPQHTLDVLTQEMEQALTPKSIAGFRIIRKLGQGGMGSVYLAEQLSLHRQVALKVIAPQFAADVQSVDRFMREARTAAAINHPNIISVIDVGYHSGHLYMALELVSGGDAAQLAARFNGVLPEARALEIILDCTHGLHALFEARLIHRDIKPANIFITREGTAKLADLGLARSEQGDDRLTVSGHTIGTPAFMSPEQASGKSDIDIRSDIYSLGAALLALATGSPPFTGEGIFAIAAKLLTEPAPDPRSLNPTVSPATAQVIARCLAKQPAERFQTPHELSIAISAALAVLSTTTPTRPLTTLVARPLSEEVNRAHPTPATVAPRKSRPPGAPRSPRSVPWPMISGIIAVIAVAVVIGMMWNSRTPELRRASTSPAVPTVASPERDRQPLQAVATVVTAERDQQSHSTTTVPSERPSVTGPAIRQDALTADVTPSAVPAVTLPEIKGLIAYWPLDEGSGSQVRDHVGKNSTGTITNATWGPGKVGSALVFSQPSKVVCGNAANLTPTDGITVMCWIKTKMVVPDHYLASVLRHDGHFTALQVSPDGTAHASIWGWGDMKMAVFPWRGVWDDGQWHHYAVTYDSSSGTRIYMDGKLFATPLSSFGGYITGKLPDSVQTPFMLGASELNNEYFNGSLDEIRVYDHPLSAAEIKQLAAMPVH
jgi:serine/threonine protein kinase